MGFEHARLRDRRRWRDPLLRRSHRLHAQHASRGRGKALVAGVSRGNGCALLLTSQWPDKVGSAILYTALGPEEFAQLRADLEANGVASKDGWWGKPLLIVEDPEGNQLYFPVP